MPVNPHQSSSRAAPLFDWQSRKRIDAVRSRREALAEMIRRMPRHSHRRIILEAQLAAITQEQLRLEHESELSETLKS